MPTQSQKSLGRLVRIFRYPTMGWKDVSFLILPGICAVILPLWYGFTRFRIAEVGYGPVAAAHWSQPWYALSIIALVIFTYVSIGRIRRALRYVSVHEKGLRISLKKVKTLRWEEIAGVTMDSVRYHFAGIKLRSGFTGVLYPNTGKSIVLPQAINNLPELLTLIKAKLYPRLLPLLQANLESGQWLYFGPLSLRTDGLEISGRNIFHPKKSVRWAEVNRMDIVSGYLVVELSDKTTQKLPVSKIPNIELLLQLIQTGVNP